MTRLRPVLDDLTYADLIASARARIPALAPEWTDHNPSDPGITLVELFAFFAEMLAYQADELPPDRSEAFLRLLNGPGWTPTGDPDDDVTATLATLRSPWRAASADDVVRLLTSVWPDDPRGAALGAIRRVRCLPGRDLTSEGGPDQPAPGQLTVVVVPAPEPGDPAGLPAGVSAEFRSAVHAWLEPRRLLGVRHSVVGPAYVPVTVTARLILRSDYAPAAVAATGVLTDAAIAAEAGREGADAVTAHLHPLTGGADGAGWPFGRSVYAAELYARLDGLPGVDYVDGLRFVDLPADRAISVDGEVAGARLAGHELVAVTVVDDSGTPGRLTVAPAGRAGGPR
jgi:hypothetical protein